jgi:paraquat-inducible protein A
MRTDSLLACHECDLLQQEATLPPGGIARCRRCGAQLYRNHPEGLTRSLAFILGALILFMIANMFPMVALELRGERIQTTLLGAVRAIYADGMWPIAVIVFVTAILTPLAEMTALAYLLVPLHLERMSNRRTSAAAPAAQQRSHTGSTSAAGRIPRRHALAFRVMRLAQPWVMVDVLMLGMLVVLVRLAGIASVTPGIALCSLGGVMLLLAAAAAAFDPHDLWAELSAAR